MAKNNLFLGTATGKVGDVVMYRYAGTQCSRVRVRSIKNPKSTGQQIQRAIIATVAQAYSYLRSICDHSFESVSYGVKSMNYFNKVNAKKLRINFFQNYDSTTSRLGMVTAPNVTALVPNNYTISKGTLTANLTSYSMDEDYDTLITSNAASTIGELFDTLGVYNINSIATIIQIQAATPHEEMWIDPVTYLYTTGDAGDGQVIPKVNVAISRMVRNTTALSDDDAALEITAANISSILDTYFENSSELTPVEDDSTTANAFAYLLGHVSTIDAGNKVKIGHANGFITYAGAFINSYYDDTTWRRSTSELVVNPNVFSDTNAYGVYMGLAPAVGREVWTSSDSSATDSEYLLNGAE